VSDTVQASTVRSVIKNTGHSLGALEPQYAAGLGGGLADYSRAVQVLGGGWDAQYVAHGLLPLGNTLAFFTDITLDRVDIVTGFNVTTWTHITLPNLNSPMFSMDVSGLETLIVWQETNTLEARMLSGDTPPGWPVSIEASG